MSEAPAGRQMCPLLNRLCLGESCAWYVDVEDNYWGRPVRRCAILQIAIVLMRGEEK